MIQEPRHGLAGRGTSSHLMPVVVHEATDDVYLGHVELWRVGDKANG